MSSAVSDKSLEIAITTSVVSALRLLIVLRRSAVRGGVGIVDKCETMRWIMVSDQVGMLQVL